MDFFSASIIVLFLMVSSGALKGYHQYDTHPTNNIKNLGHLKNEIEIYKNKISGKNIKVLHYLNIKLFKVLDDELIEEFTDFSEDEFFKYYEKTVQAPNLKTANGSLLLFKSK